MIKRIFQIICIAASIQGFSLTAATLDDLVDQYITKEIPRPNDLMYANIDFGNGPGSAALIGQGYNNYDKICGYSWTIYVKDKNQWREPKTRDSVNGNIIAGGTVDFDFWFAGNVYFPKYKHKGLLYYYPRGKCWTFTYLDKADDTLKSVEFRKASEVNMTEDQLVRLRESGQIEIKHRELK